MLTEAGGWTALAHGWTLRHGLCCSMHRTLLFVSYAKYRMRLDVIWTSRGPLWSPSNARHRTLHCGHRTQRYEVRSQPLEPVSSRWRLATMGPLGLVVGP